ncbi:hypothetical protein F444_21634 [Phytophthora nicotianae P1976]|uniref:ZSWIM1/3 RNaseH-like domain-containing protein n=1 Tax=Phytophthora nicotianae P1976 TaxID=1317066 RepID=A0A080Z0H0_PHYNI|nr:hypothetical protein F444_21634 [Phytophthora nicotianae P1976]
MTSPWHKQSRCTRAKCGDGSKLFPEVLLVDATHNTNDLRYKLFSFMVHDVYGHGQYVQHSLMKNETTECLADAIEAYKFSNPSWEQIRVIVIGKDMDELSLLEAHFPHIKVVLCQFHLKKYIRSEMKKSKYGGPSSFDMDQVEDAVLRTSPTIEDYTKYLKYLYFLFEPHI